MKNKLRGLLGRPTNDAPEPNDVVARLRRNGLQVKQVRGSDVLEIRVTWDDPELARDIANTAVDVFIERYQEFNRGRAQRTRAYLQQQVDLVKRRLDESEEELVKFQEVSGMISPPDAASDVVGLLDSLMVEKAHAELSRALAQAELEELDRGLPELKDGPSDAKSRDAVEAAIAAQRLLQRTGLEVRIRAYDEQLSRLRARIAQLEKESGRLPKAHRYYLTLTREQQVDEELYTLLNRKLAAAQIDEDMDQYADVRVFDPAVAPLKPLNPRPMAMAHLGMLMGALLGLLLALVKNRDKAKCLCCHNASRRALQVAHIRAQYSGTGNPLDNHQVLCGVCNRAKGSETINFTDAQTKLTQPGMELPSPRSMRIPVGQRARDVHLWRQFLARTVNSFYRCGAVDEVVVGRLGDSRHTWTVRLRMGNDPEWLRPHLRSLLAECSKARREAKLRALKMLTIESPHTEPMSFWWLMSKDIVLPVPDKRDDPVAWQKSVAKTINNSVGFPVVRAVDVGGPDEVGPSWTIEFKVKDGVPPIELEPHLQDLIDAFRAARRKAGLDGPDSLTVTHPEYEPVNCTVSE